MRVIEHGLEIDGHLVQLDSAFALNALQGIDAISSRHPLLGPLAKRLHELLRGEPIQIHVSNGFRPLLIALSQFGAVIKGDPQVTIDAACNRIVKGFPKRFPKDEIASIQKLDASLGQVMSAFYEAYVFLVFRRSGFNVNFLEGESKPEMLDVEAEILIECKDLKSDNAIRSDFRSLALSIASHVSKAEQQMRTFDPAGRYHRIVCLDLPEGFMETFRILPNSDQDAFFRSWMNEVEHPFQVIMSSFECHQHLRSERSQLLRLQPPAWMKPPYPGAVPPWLKVIHSRIEKAVVGV